MKLFEILRPSIRTQQMRVNFDLDKLNNDLSDKIDNAELDDVGAYGSVKRHDRIPHEVSKTTHLPSNLQKDGYFQYVHAIQTHMKDNPFLPRIYDITIKRAKNGMTKPVYRIEKLHSYTDITLKSVIAVGSKCFSNFERVAETALNGLSILSTPDDKRTAVWRKLCSLVYHTAIGYGDRAIEEAGEINPKLDEACQIVHRLMASHNLINDMHFGNFMVRITSTGAQLVITDPLSDGGSSVVGSKHNYFD